MDNMKKVIEDLNISKYALISPQTLNREMFIRIGQAISAAIALLEDQEPVEPVVKKRELAHMLFWCCGSCGAAITDGDKFCRMCGKKVKWNE